MVFEAPKKEILPQYKNDEGEEYNSERGEIPEWIYNEALLINEALENERVTKTDATEGLVEDKEILDMMRKMVDIKYFVEYPPENVALESRGKALQNLFQQEVEYGGQKKPLADFLSENHQGVSIAMITMDPDTAEAIRYLNQKNVPVVGWVVVDDLKGYWTNPSNITETEKQTQAIRSWAKENNLQMAALGFDIEKPIQLLSALIQGNVREFFAQYRAYRAKARGESAKGDPEVRLSKLIDDLRAENVSTEVYTMPKFFKGLLGGMDVRGADQYVEMLYSSVYPGFFRKYITNTLRSEGAIPALGLVTGKENETPGRDLSGKGELPPHLTSEELEADIGRVLDRELDFGNRKFNLRNLYLFALNDARVALMMDATMKRAFEARAPQASH